MTTATAPGKVILFGEHAVVYNRPAIAVPVTQVAATAEIVDAPTGAGIMIVAADLDRTHVVGKPTDELTAPLDLIVRQTLDYLDQDRVPDLTLSIRSTIPIGGGMGSGAAVSAAVVRALAQHFDHPLSPAEVSTLVYESEVLHHETPSGIDNTVVSYGKPVYFVRDEILETFGLDTPFRLAIADTGIASPTKVAVAQVRRDWEADRPRYDQWFDDIGEITDQAREAMEAGDISTLGRLMDENQKILRWLDVSCPELDRLVAAAKEVGALGAKLVGAGCGGNMIALVDEDTEASVVKALRRAEASRVLVTQVG